MPPNSPQPTPARLTGSRRHTASRLLLASLALLLISPVGAAPAATLPVADARALSAPAQAATPLLIPAPTRAEFQAGTLPLGGLGLAVRGNAPELGWAARDLRAEWRTRLGLDLPDGGGLNIVVGMRDDPDLAARAQAAGLLNTQPEGYALWVDATGAYVVGADARGAYLGAQTLRQLLTPAGLRYARVSDAPALAQRVAMIYLDQYSQGVNDRLIPMLAQLKYNQVLIMSNYVQWDVARAGGWAHPGGASKAEAARVAQLARDYGLEPIPLIETLGHTGWMFYGNKNLDLVQDPQSQSPYAYDTLNPATYDRVVLPVLKEAVEVFKPRFVHIGHDEVRNKDRFPARPNGVAAGFEKLFVDDTIKLHDYLKGLNVGTMIWHDTAFADAFAASIPPQLPNDIVVAYWNYNTGADYPLLATIKAAGFPTLGAAWFDPLNPENFAKSAQKYAVGGMIQTRWTGYFGNPSIWDGAAEQGQAYLRAANAFWNPAAPPLAAPDLAYRDLYQPTPYRAVPGALVDLTPLVTRSLTDKGGQGWIGKGTDTDLSQLPTGDVRLGAYRFHISGAVMLRGSRPAASSLPERATIELNRKLAGLAFLHTTGWSSPTNREQIGRIEIAFENGQTLTQPLEYGRHIRAWTDLVPTSMVQAPAWRGQTKDGLDVALGVLEWQNPTPDAAVRSVSYVSEGKSANPTLLGLTILDSAP